MKRVKVTYLGDEEYGSVDPGDMVAPGLGRLISLAPGGAAYVSVEKAAQMAEDFPQLFEFGEAEEVTDDEYIVLALGIPADVDPTSGSGPYPAQPVADPNPPHGETRLEEELGSPVADDTVGLVVPEGQVALVKKPSTRPRRKAKAEA